MTTLEETLRTALAHHAGGRLEAARSLYDSVLAREPDHPDALHLLGVLARQEGHNGTAIALISRVVAAHPGFAEAHGNLGNALLDSGRVAEAAAAFRQALALKPGFVDMHRHLLGALLYLPGLDPTNRLAEHRAFAAQHEPPPDQRLPPPTNDPDPARRLRIGILSSDFRDHPIGRVMTALYRWTDRTAFTLLSYADVALPDARTAWFQTASDQWRPVHGLDDRTVAAMIRQDAVDLLMITAGRTDANRPLVASYRPAPVQLSYADGATSGLAAMDYLLTDGALSPRHSTERFTERLIRLPTLHQFPPLEEAPDPAPPPSLANGFVTFGSFNAPKKISDPTLVLWASLLGAVPEARLLLKYKRQYRDDALRARLLARLEALGVASERVLFREGGDMTAHLADYGQVDIALDTQPYSGATTSFEALWMGVPVVTLPGDSYIARMSAALLRRLRLDELIAHDADGFVAAAAALAQDPARLAGLRASLRERVADSSLCDAPRAARWMGRTWRALWRRWAHQAVS